MFSHATASRLFVFAMLLTIVWSAAAVGQEWTYNPATGNSYRLSTSGSWDQCEAEAVSLGGHLVAINDAAENQWALDTFPTIPNPLNQGYWIGFTDAAVEGAWVWSNGDPVTYTNWYPGEPVGGTVDNTAYMYAYNNDHGRTPGTWDDYGWQVPAHSRPGIIERPGPPPTGPVFTVPIAQYAVFAAVHPNRPRLYVSHEGAYNNQGRVTVLETGACIESASVLTNIQVSTDAFGLRVHPNGQQLYVACRNANTIAVVELDALGDPTGAITQVPVGASPHFVTFNPSGTLAYVSNWDSGTASIIDTASLTVVDTCTIGDGPREIVLSPAGSRFYVCHDFSDTLTVHESDTCAAVGGPLPLGLAPGWMGMARTSTGGVLYVPNNDDASLSKVIVSGDSVSEELRISVGGNPTGVAVSLDEAYVYAAMSDDDQLWVLDASSLAHLDTVSVGDDPIGVTLNPDGTRLYVVNDGHDGPNTTLSIVALNDIDGDGVPDSQDLCQTTPLCLPVDCEGRPRADLNGDCLLNGLDIQLMVEQLLNQ